MKFAVLLTGLLAASPAAAQSPVVACAIGGWEHLTRPGVCDILHRDTAPLRVHHGTAFGAILCQRDLARDLDLGGPHHNEGVAISTAAAICSDIFQANPEWVR